LLPKEPANTKWAEYGYSARLVLASELLATGKRDDAAEQTNLACGAIGTLLRRDPRNVKWRGALSDCWAMRARVAMVNGDVQLALEQARAALDTGLALHSGDATTDGYRIAIAYRIIGDVEQKLGNSPAARSAWSSGLAAFPSAVPEQPNEMSERASLLRRLGRATEAQALAGNLSGMGYRAQE